MEQNTDAGAPMTSAVENKQKSGGNGLKIATAIACVVAVCGIGFGVFSVIDSSNKSQEISKLKIENDNLKGNKEDNISTENVFQNPIIKSEVLNGATLFEEFMIETDDEYRLYIGVKDGKINSCYIGYDVYSSQCEIAGLNGNIYKMIEFNRGLDSSSTYIGFIMEDSTMNYFAFGCDNGCFNVANYTNFTANRLKIDGFVVDGLSIHVPEENYGGYPSTVFVLDDGSYLQFSESML